MAKNRSEQTRKRKLRKDRKRKDKKREQSRRPQGQAAGEEIPQGRVFYVPEIAANGQMLAMQDDESDLLMTWAYLDKGKAEAMQKASPTPIRLDTVDPLTFLTGITTSLVKLGIDLVILDDEVALATSIKGAAVAAEKDPRWHTAIERGLLPVVATRVLTEYVAGVRTPLGLDDDPVRFLVQDVGEDLDALQRVLDEGGTAITTDLTWGPREGETFVVHVKAPASGNGAVPLTVRNARGSVQLYTAEQNVTQAVYDVLGDLREGYLHAIRGGEEGREFYLDTHRLLEGWS